MSTVSRTPNGLIGISKLVYEYIREMETSSREDAKASFSSSRPQPARLNQYTILELARLPSISKKAMVEDWLERVCGKAVAPSATQSEGSAGIQELDESGKTLEKNSLGESLSSEGGVLASRPATGTERSPLCDVDTEMVERKIYKWRKWATESV